jgi:hypothetical protein
MDGPEILARSLTLAKIKDQYGNTWQYHSQSDNHSKLACWTLLFDVLQHCPLLVQHVQRGKVGFGINHQMYDFRTARTKNLDLVLCTPSGVPERNPESFAQEAGRYSVDLTAAQRTKLDAMPPLPCVSVGSVYVALEAKACMTEHVKALPRLYDELNSSHLAIHGSADFAIAAGYVVVNRADSFISPGRNKYNISVETPMITSLRQPAVSARAIDKMREIPRRTQQGAEGFDALGIVLLKLQNDGSAVEIVNTPPAPPAGDALHYDQLVHRIASLYATKFGNV